jgi:hypothetical protein
MSPAVCKRLKKQSWRDLYQAAIYESDLNKLPKRIEDAEGALIICARELFYGAGDDDGEEAESLDDAMCILHALRSSLKRRPTSIQSTSNLDYLRSA